MENRSPLLSVVVVTYNHKKYIKSCLDSILKQKTTFEFEIIVADDNSRDETVEYVEQLYGSLVVIINREKNIGLCANMYDAYTKARGKYIFDCSGDDYLPVDDVLQKHIDFLEEHPDFFSVANWYEYYNVNKGEKRTIKIRYGEYCFNDFLKGVPVEFYLGTMRNTFLKDSPTFLCNASHNNEEIQMLYYTLSKGKKKILPEVLYTYCYRERNDTSNYCSTRNDRDVLEDYAKGFRAIEKVDKGKNRFNIAKMKYYEKYFDKIVDKENVRGIYTICKTIGIKDFLNFLAIKLAMRLRRKKSVLENNKMYK